MTISELIAQLQALQAQHGDLPVKGGLSSEPWDTGAIRPHAVFYWPDCSNGPCFGVLGE